jgi:hypothetical protein
MQKAKINNTQNLSNEKTAITGTIIGGNMTKSKIKDSNSEVSAESDK